MIIAYGLFLTLTVYLLFLNFNSLKLQNLVAADVKNGKLTHPASLFLNGFPIIPDLNVFSVPNDADKARYLINEKRNDEAIALLKKNKSNHFDDMSSLFISLAYHNQNNIDSSLTYIRKAYNLRPNKFKNVSNLCVLLHQKGRVKEAENILNNYLDKNKNNADAWLFTFVFFNRTGDIQKAVSTIDSAAHYLPSNDRILKQKSVIKSGSNH